MKKIILILAALLAISVMLVSCSDEPATTPNNQEVENNEEVTPNEQETETPDAPEATTSTILTAEELQAKVDGIYEKYPVPFMAGPIPAEMINADSYAYYTGLADDSQVSAVVVSESMIGAQAYSLVMLSVKEGEDVQAVANAMINGIDQRKWMCVEADLIRTVTHGNTVMLVMIDSSMEIGIDGFVTAFEEVVGAVEFEATKA